MAVEKTDISKFLELAKRYPVLDVRSPAEYKHAHIPGAYSLPLFSDEERKVVGTAYKQESREQAIKIGLDYFGVKMKKMIEEVETLMKDKKAGAGSELQASDSFGHQRLAAGDARVVLVHCWRGGMRSAGIAWLLDLYGFKVYTLVGGYKKFRNYVLSTFSIPFRFNILGGYTGSAKTEMLKLLQQQDEIVVDLEGIAGHKGSAFGNIGLPPQPGQEMFENLLALELRKAAAKIENQHGDPPVWLEDESQRIGMVNIPGEIWKNMRQSPICFLDIPFEERLRHIVQEYGHLDPEKVVEAIGRISQKLGNLNAKTSILLLKEGKISESFEILLHYYDKYYLKALHNREGINSLLYTIPCKSITPENASLLTRFSRNPEKI